MPFNPEKMSISSPEDKKGREEMPGGEYIPRPIEIAGKFYDPFDPPRLHMDSDGNRKYIGGKELSKKEVDEIYSKLFWRSKGENKEFLEDLRKSMTENIKKAAQTGEFGIFADPGGPTLEDKEKFSAYRRMAEELGYKIGEGKFSEKTYMLGARIENILEKKGQKESNTDQSEKKRKTQTY